MPVFSLGKITVPTAGTIVQASAASIPCAAIRVTPLAGNTGNIIPGDPTLVTSTLVGAYHDGLSSGQIWTLDSPSGANLLNLNRFYIDATVNGEGAVIEYIQA